MDRQPFAITPNYYPHVYAQQAAHRQQYHDPSALVSLGYSPLQFFYQQQQQQQQRPEIEQAQLSLTAAGFHDPNFRPRRQPLPLRSRKQSRQQQHNMEYPQSDEDSAKFQKLRNEYEPEITVSVVKRRCSGVIWSCGRVQER